MKRQRIVVTGGAGILGQVLCAALARDHDVHCVDRRRGGRDRWTRIDMRNLASVERTFGGHDAVVDLAANADAGATWQCVYENNLPATMHAFEAARRAGIRRVIYASSNHVTGLYERDDPYVRILAGRLEGLDPAAVPRLTTSLPIRPDGPYGIGKALGEAAARYYAEEFGVSIICLRIGTVTRSGAPSTVRQLSTLLTHDDLVRMVQAALAAPQSIGFGIYYGVSRNSWRIWDISDAQAEIGYEPEDDAERWRGGIAAEEI